MTTAHAKPVSIVLMVLLLFATQACTDIFLPGLPAIAREFGVSMAVANHLISAYNISQAAVVLFIGVVSDLRGRRATLLVCLALHIAASIWIALSNSLPWMVAMRVVHAAGSAAVYIVLRLVIKDTLDKQAQIHATGLLVIGLVLSPILAPALGAGIIAWSGWRNCFWAIALVEVPLFIWAWRAVSETNQQSALFRAAFSWKGHFLHYAAVLRDRYFLGMALLIGAAFAAFYAFIGISSYLYIGQYGVPASRYALVFIGVALFYLLGNRMMSRLNARQVPLQRIIKAGVAVSLLGAVVLCVALVASSRIVILVAITLGTCLLRLATALINPPVQVVVTNHFATRGSHALGLLTCIQYGFAAVGTVVVSSLPFTPLGNFTCSTVLFVLLCAAGYAFAFKAGRSSG